MTLVSGIDQRLTSDDVFMFRLGIVISRDPFVIGYGISVVKCPCFLGIVRFVKDTGNPH